MKVLVIDVGGSNVKCRATGQDMELRFTSGPVMSAQAMVDGVLQRTRGWDYDRVAIGYPGAVKNDQPVREPHNLGPGWVDFDYRAAFGKPVKIINDAAMQALGSYAGGKLLFLGLGTGLGTAMVVDGMVLPTELAHLPYRKKTFEDHVGEKALERDGKKKWRKTVFDVVARLTAALLPDDVVIGGGNVRLLTKMPPLCRKGDNENAFVGGFRLWQGSGAATTQAPTVVAPVKAGITRKAPVRKAP
ncbi:MAG: ROK family protein, partial [Rubrivivax sp.]